MTCEFYPFGTHADELWKTLDGSWVRKSNQYLEGRFGAESLEALFRQYLSVFGDDQAAGAATAFFSSLNYALFARRDAQGKTPADYWEAESWKGLNNDETIMMKHRRKGFVAVIEIQRVVDKNSLEVIDLLDPNPKPLLLRDAEIAETLPRFSKLFVWIVQYPHFHSLSAPARMIPNMIWPEWEKTIRQRARIGVPAGQEPDLRRYLAEHFPESIALVKDELAATRQRLIDALDAHQCMAEYRIQGTEEDIKQILAGKPELILQPPPAEDDPNGKHLSFRWEATPESDERFSKAGVRQLKSTVPGWESAIAFLRLYPGKVILHCLSKVKYAYAREKLAEYFGAKLEFVEESIIDLTKQVSDIGRAWPERESDSAGAGAPAAEMPQDPVTAKEEIYKQHREQFQALLDQAAPELNGMTPRAAAASAEIRPALAHWLKTHLCNIDFVNKRDGLALNLDWILDELKFSELK